MKCADCQDVLAEFALDSLPPEESGRVAEHLAQGCTNCQQHLDDVRAAWAALVGTLPPAQPPAHIKADLLARVHDDLAPCSIRRGIALTPEPEPVTLSGADRKMQVGWRWQSMLPYIAATLCGIAAGYWFARGATFDSALIGRYEAQLLQAERTFGAPQMRFAALHLSENLPEIRGYLIWDSVAAELHVYAFDLGAPPEGSVYRFWLVTDSLWTPAGDLAVQPDGVCATVIKLPALEKPVSRVVVTTEPDNGTRADATAHGPIQLVGEFLQE
jgi:hypothetical protein